MNCLTNRIPALRRPSVTQIAGCRSFSQSARRLFWVPEPSKGTQKRLVSTKGQECNRPRASIYPYRVRGRHPVISTSVSLSTVPSGRISTIATHRTLEPRNAGASRIQQRAMSNGPLQTGSSTAGDINAASTTTPPSTRPQFQVSPIPRNWLREGRCIRTAAALIIGDEILNGKTLDSNSNVFAQFCFEHGIDLKRVEVVPDDENEIIEAARRLTAKFDFVITSGGIGPTHDDITYESLAKAFNTTVVHHEETIRRMQIMNKHRKWASVQTEQQRAASYRMALFPATAEVIFVDPEIWVPVVRLEGKLCVFPGVPALFQKMLHSLAGFLPLPPKSERPLRIQIFTDRPESMIAPYLTELQERLKPHGIQVGSYPVLYKGVFVSLIGRDLASPPSSPSSLLASSPHALPASSAIKTKKSKGIKNRVWLAEIAREVEQEVGGRVLSDEEVVLQKESCSIALGENRKKTGQLEDLPANASAASNTEERGQNKTEVKAKY